MQKFSGTSVRGVKVIHKIQIITQQHRNNTLPNTSIQIKRLTVHKWEQFIPKKFHKFMGRRKKQKGNTRIMLLK